MEHDHRTNSWRFKKVATTRTWKSFEIGFLTRAKAAYYKWTYGGTYYNNRGMRVAGAAAYRVLGEFPPKRNDLFFCDTPGANTNSRHVFVGPTKQKSTEKTRKFGHFCRNFSWPVIQEVHGSIALKLGSLLSLRSQKTFLISWFLLSHPGIVPATSTCGFEQRVFSVFLH